MRKGEKLRVLISAVGMTDPISNEHDGSILHICRVYQPDILYLYMSRRVLGFHDIDDRYRKCIKWLGKSLAHEFDIRVIKDEDMTAVQEYDIFIDIFQKIIKTAISENPKAEVLLNVSSGTPGMKGALQTIPYITEYNLMPIQVSTPEDDYNKHHEDHEDYNVDIQWELNRDNLPDYRNRCKESNGKNLLTVFKKEQIVKYIRTYHYESAYFMAGDMNHELSPKALLWLEIARARGQLNLDKVQQICSKNKIDNPYMPVEEEPYRSIVEYLLSLQIKLIHGSYGDFIRALTPVILDLLILVLEEQCNMRLENYADKDRGLWCWNKNKLEKYPKILKGLNKKFQNDFRYGPVYSSALIPLLEMGAPSQLINMANQLRNCEKYVRNSAAHAMVSVTPEWIEKRCNCKPEEIMNCLKELVKYTKLGDRPQIWKSYDSMNQCIIEQIR